MLRQPLIDVLFPNGDDRRGVFSNLKDVGMKEDQGEGAPGGWREGGGGDFNKVVTS